MDAILSPDDGEDAIDDESNAKGDDSASSNEAWELVAFLEVVEPRKKEKDKGD